MLNALEEKLQLPSFCAVSFLRNQRGGLLVGRSASGGIPRIPNGPPVRDPVLLPPEP